MSNGHLKTSAIKPPIPGLLFDFKKEITFLISSIENGVSSDQSGLFACISWYCSVTSDSKCQLRLFNCIMIILSESKHVCWKLLSQM